MIMTGVQHSRQGEKSKLGEVAEAVEHLMTRKKFQIKGLSVFYVMFICEMD